MPKGKVLNTRKVSNSTTRINNSKDNSKIQTDSHNDKSSTHSNTHNKVIKAKQSSKKQKHSAEKQAVTAYGKKDNISGVAEKTAKKRVKWWFVSLALVGVCFITVLFILGIKVKFLLDDELVVSLSPNEAVINTTNSETVWLDFKVKTRNFPQCSSFCNLSVFDYTNNKVVFRSNISLKHNDKQEISLQFSTPITGTGTSLFNVELECSNLRSRICLTNQDKRYISSLVVLNYDLREKENQIISNVKDRLEYDLLLFANLSRLNKENKVLMSRLNMEDMEEPGWSEDLGFDELDYYRDLWDRQIYEELGIRFKEHSLLILKKIQDFESAQAQIIADIKKHNHLVSLFDFPTGDMLILLGHFKENSNKHNLDVLNKMESSSMRIQAEFEKVLLNKTPGNISADKASLIETVAAELEMLNESRMVVGLYNALLEKRNLSIGIVAVSFCRNTTQIKSAITKWNALVEYDFKMLTQKISNTSNSSGIILQPETIYSIEDAGNRTNIYLSTGETEEIERLHCYDKEYNDMINPVWTQKLIENHYSLEGFYIDTDIPNVTIMYEPLNIPSRSCCAFGTCNNCITNRSPILFIHGHSFNEKNTPQTSMNSFGKFENALRNYRFVNAGQLKITNTDSWGSIGYPTSARATYYYITHYDIGSYTLFTQKSERIENYALRLKEIIEHYKQKTNSNKVIIVAHSMGGLVAREYLLLFGPDSVEKLVLINTPNKGVKGRIKKLCPILGAKKECEDLSEGSVFLNRINSRTMQGVEVHAIYSTGCEMEGEDGDGIVTAESAKLDGAILHEIKGSCTDMLNSDLHTNIMDVDKYPITLEILGDILQ